MLFLEKTGFSLEKNTYNYEIENSGSVKACYENVQIRGEILNNGRMEVHWKEFDGIIN